MEINPINSKRIYQSIIEQFIELIKQGKLAIGQKLPAERQLAEMFKVSRASIREAFSAMEIIGLIEVRPGEGSFVTDINIVPFINTIAPLFVKNDNMEKDLLEFRKLLELESVRLAVKKIDQAELGEIETALSMMKASMEKLDANLGAEADIKFHKEIFRITGNYILIKASECIASILESSVRFNREKILRDAKNAEVLYKQHQQIFEALKLQYEALAVERMETHLTHVQRMT